MNGASPHNDLSLEEKQQLRVQASFETEKTLNNMTEWVRTFNPQTLFGSGGQSSAHGGQLETIHQKYAQLVAKLYDKSWALMDARANDNLTIWRELGAQLPPTSPHDESLLGLRHTVGSSVDG